MRVLSHHWTDDIHPQDSGQRQRTIRNWTNYQTPAGIWAPSDPALEPITQAPADWPSGWPFPFTQGCWRSPLQVALGDNSDPANTALIGVRHSNRPECGLILKPLGVNAVPMTLDIATKTVKWTDLWTDADLEYQVANGRLSKMITMRTSFAPAAYRFAYKLFPGMSAAIVGGAVQISDAQGQQVLTLKPPWALDANNTPIRAAFSLGNNITYRGVTYQTFWLTPDAQDLASAVYPVRLDPTAVISGTTNLEDVSLDPGSPDANWGAWWAVYWTGALMRVATSAIPSGTISSAVLSGYTAGVAADRVVRGYRIAEANYGWAEGTAAGSAQVGSCCWNKRVYNTTNWAGAVGCAGAADYDGATPSADYTWPTLTWGNMPLVAQWFTDWKSGAWLNAGMILWRIGSGGPAGGIESTEYDHPPYITITYTAPGGSMPWLGARR